MISSEPVIRVGIVDRRHSIAGESRGRFLIDGYPFDGQFSAIRDGAFISLTDADGKVISRASEILFKCENDSTFTLHDVTIGSRFHWERKENQTFHGDLRLMLRDDGSLVAINMIHLEKYLASVISSEMNPDAPVEFLKAHAIASRSWLVNMLEREQKHVGLSSLRTLQSEGELLRWYDREDHDLYDVCADDHCQRYQGISKILSSSVAGAVRASRGVFLTQGGEVCDASFSKSCGGLTERYASCWEDVSLPYLQSIPDSRHPYDPVVNEHQAEAWIRSTPEAYCNTTDKSILGQILPAYDQETADFFRWKVKYRREELETVLSSKSGIDFGTLMNLIPVQRGPSGRIVKLRIQGTRKTLTLGKELEIRRWLAQSHLYSSAFVVETKRDAKGVPEEFVLYGGGWGHGVGLCQIGAAVMASGGRSAEEILKHYYRGTELKKLYS